MSRKFAEYVSNACLGYALVFFGTVVLGVLLPEVTAELEAGDDPNLVAVVLSGAVMLFLMIVGAWFAVKSERGR